MSDSKVTSLDTAPATPTAVAKATVAAKTVKTTGGGDASLSGVKKTLEIYAKDGEDGDQDVLVGLNGVMYQIKRGETVEVPEEVLFILRNAITTVTSPAPAGGVTTRDVPRYQFNVLA